MDLHEMILSPVCGRVRFACDVKGLAYRSKIHTPGLSDRTLKKIAGKVMVPTLVDGAEVIQGSDKILAHLEAKKPTPNILGTNEQERAAIRRYTELFDELVPLLRTDIVVRTRANLEGYSKETPLGALPSFIRLPIARMALDRFSEKWQCDEARVAQNRDRILSILRTLAPQLKPGRYLVGHRVTDADICICELTLLFRPPSDSWVKVGHQTRTVYHAEWIDAQIAYPFEVWRDELYKSHRAPRAHAA